MVYRVDEANKQVIIVTVRYSKASSDKIIPYTYKPTLMAEIAPERGLKAYSH